MNSVAASSHNFRSSSALFWEVPHAMCGWVCLVDDDNEYSIRFIRLTVVNNDAMMMAGEGGEIHRWISTSPM
jgi:hypothetical protein